MRRLNNLMRDNIFVISILKMSDIEMQLFITIGRIKRSNFGGLRVNPSPTKQGFVTKRFHAFSINMF